MLRFVVQLLPLYNYYYKSSYNYDSINIIHTHDKHLIISSKIGIKTEKHGKTNRKNILNFVNENREKV